MTRSENFSSGCGHRQPMLACTVCYPAHDERMPELTPHQKQRRDYYEAKPHKALELLNALENMERRFGV